MALNPLLLALSHRGGLCWLSSYLPPSLPERWVSWEQALWLSTLYSQNLHIARAHQKSAEWMHFLPCSHSLWTKPFEYVHSCFWREQQTLSLLKRKKSGLWFLWDDPRENFMISLDPKEQSFWNLAVHFIYLFVCFFMALLGLCCYTQAFSSCGERGLLFVAVHGLLTAVASLVAEHGL